ncbi:uncharacterized protein LOC113521978 isoform X1 [Galleria mellonella]|uniref:Uncharacterized protein LOC113521978 isoform X1 n=1 Tax=Galleria mellonella TaxID=7137 RepID=A0A6J1X8C2_GALME|nr:uncharacterized protein LOC113521978 isoform X1 [Galleria mellonella]
MKGAVIVLVAIVAMASAQDRVNVVDENPDYRVKVVDNSDPNSQDTVITNPDPGFYRPTNPQNGGDFVINNPDPQFYRPTNPNSNGGYEPISTGPALVEGSRPSPNYPYKQYAFPGARGGK